MARWLGPWQFLFFSVVVVALGFLAWWPFAVVEVTTEGIKWTDLVSAIGVPVVIVLSAFFALMQLRESEKSRFAALAADLTRRWDEDVLVESRRTMSALSHDQIKDVVQAIFEERATAEETDCFYKLQPVPNFIEGIAAIEEEFAGLTLEFVDRLWGSSIIRAWQRWAAAVEYVRNQPNGRTVFQNFERLAKRLEEKRGLPPASAA